MALYKWVLASLEGILIAGMIFFTILICAKALEYATGNTVNTVVKYDCRLAEISPDFPQEVKTQCRKLMEKK